MSGEAPSVPLLEAGESEYGYDRPSDELILKQQDQIRWEQSKKVDVVGDLEELSALMEEYANEAYAYKIGQMKLQYSCFRRIQSDGNCFFRAFIYGYLEQLINHRDAEECMRVAACLREKREVLCAQGYEALVFEETLEALINYIERIVPKSVSGSGTQGDPVVNLDDALSPEELQIAFRDDSTAFDLMTIMLLRLLASSEIQRREEFFLPFVLGMSDSASCASFCRSHVEPMNEESDHIHIVALSDCLQIPVRVVYLDATGNATGTAEHDFIPEGIDSSSPPRVYLLYRPGHYDILYPFES